MSIRLKRAYDPPGEDDGYRVLIDRIWPRGVGREAARLDVWLKEIAPSDELRKWFGHDPNKWKEFKNRYFQELDERPEVVEELMKAAIKHSVTLVFAAKDREFNNAVALEEYLKERMKE
ncbi:DUF488 domain-containing protein [Desulforhabdus amnigena]|jgi:uncharacterized protein YeaO (DUF488 family)|uniref:DUF488 domain-containing protein n=1 Tax=Desulforhabdus amnigena TaxID=40218 RepID=A0A9W6FVP7_9BACT|nr:DUF488 domain-containing protein [Desulforhabdus amnigena]NLJ28193.1 DUF488 domain-containing protein [Deltaproteobacteria bacterium]GLI35722.1 hypothetical protein DAMNIGENAA_31550 [Desulforhabdus amnigena]